MVPDNAPPVRFGTRCESCGQSPQEYEKDLLPEKQELVAWNKKGKDADGKRLICEGRECTKCCRCRSNCFGNVSQKALNKAREDNPEVDAAYNRARRDLVRAEGRAKYPKYDLQSFEKEEDYLDEFEEGEFIELDTFCKENGAPADLKDFDAKCAFVAEVTGGAKVISRKGRHGVIILDTKDGHTRIKLGRRTATGREKVSSHDTGAEAAAVAAKSGLLKAMSAARETAGHRSALVPQDTPGLEVAEEEEEDEGPESEEDDGCETGETMEFDTFEVPGVTAKKKLPVQKPALKTHALKVAASKTVPPPKPPTHSCPPSSAREARPKPLLATDAGVLANLSTSQQETVKKGNEQLQKLEIQFSPEKLWDGGIRKRAITALNKSAADISSKLSALPQDCPPAHSLSESIMEKFGKIETMFDLFTAMRSDLTPFLENDIDEEGMECLLSIDLATLSTILMKFAADFVKTTESQDEMEASAALSNLFSLCQCNPAADRFGVGLLRRKASDSAGSTVASSVQHQILSLMYDKVLRAKKVDKLQLFLARCPVPTFDLAQHMTVDSASMNQDGWSSMVKLELQLLRTLVVDYTKAKALENHWAKVAMECKTSITVRLKSLLQSCQLGRTLWAKLKEAADQAITPNSLMAEIKERAGTIRNDADFCQQLERVAGSLDKTVFDTVHKMGMVFMNLIKTRDAFSQLPGSLGPDLKEDCDLISDRVDKITDFIGATAKPSLLQLTEEFSNFWNAPMQDVRLLKNFDLFVGVLAQAKALPLAINDHILQIHSAVSDLVHAHPIVREAMHSLEGDNAFASAVKACHRLERSAPLACVVGGLQQKFEGATEPECLPIFIEMVASMRTAAKKVPDMQAEWAKTLVKRGMTSKLEGLDAATKPMLSKPVQSILTNLTLHRKFTDAQYIFFNEEKLAEACASLDQQTLRTALVDFTQARAVPQEQLNELGLEGFEAGLEALGKALCRLMTGLAAAHEGIRAGVSDAWESKKCTVPSSGQPWKPEQFSQLLAADATPTDVKIMDDSLKKLAELSQKFNVVKSHAECFSGQKKLEEAFSNLTSQFSKEPLETDLANTLVAVCAAEILAAPDTVKNASKAVSNVFKFAEERGIKKDSLDKAIRSQLEAFGKECKETKESKVSGAASSSAKGPEETTGSEAPPKIAEKEDPKNAKKRKNEQKQKAEAKAGTKRGKK